MEYYKGKYCITVEELTGDSTGPAIMSYENYKKLLLRKRIESVKQGKGADNYALIDYTTLPQRFKAAFVDKWGDPLKLLKSEAENDDLVLDSSAREWYSQHRVNGVNLTEDKIEEYVLNASVANELIAVWGQVESVRRGKTVRGGATMRDIILAKAEKMKDFHGHTLPMSWARLSARLKEYKAKGYEAMVQGYVANNNAVKVTAEGGAFMVALKRSKVPVYDNEQIWREYNRVAPENGWKELKSPNTVTNYLNDPAVRIQWYDAKVGQRAARLAYDRKHKTEMPKFANSLWYGDGTKVNLYYRGVDANGRTKMFTTNVYEVFDAHSEVFLGFHISDSENYETQYAAFRMAVERAQCKPYEIVVDNQSGYRREQMRELYSKITRVSRRTAPYNPQSKSIENAFGRFQEKILRQDWRFTGANITARGQFARVDLETIEANKDKLYTIEELVVAYAEAREAWNNDLHPLHKRPRIELYMENVNPEAQPLTSIDMVDIFWKQTQESTFTSSGLQIQVDNKKYTYDVYDEMGEPDLMFRRKNTYRKFIVKYDPADMSLVRLYTQESGGRLRFCSEARPYVVIHRAIQDQEPGEMEWIRRQDERNKQNRVDMQLAAVELEMQHGVALEQHGLRRPKIAGISDKSIERFLDRAIEGTVEMESEGGFYKAVSNMTADEIRDSKM